MGMTEEKDGIHFPILLRILLLAARLLHQGTANDEPVEKVSMKQMARLRSEIEEVWNCVRLNRREGCVPYQFACTLGSSCPQGVLGDPPQAR